MADVVRGSLFDTHSGDLYVVKDKKKVLVSGDVCEYYMKSDGSLLFFKRPEPAVDLYDIFLYRDGKVTEIAKGTSLYVPNKDEVEADKQMSWDRLLE